MSENRDKKILRIGLIQNGKIVEERLLRKREPITIGQSPRNTFVLSSAGLPKTYPLFEMKGTSYFLNFRAGMNGKISVEDSVLDFRGLREQKLARKKGDNYILKLSEKSRGKVMFGEVTVLFQFVEPPPPPSKLQLPASMRGGLVGGVEMPFAYCLLGSFVVQVFSTAFITTRDYPAEVKSLDKLPNRFVEVLMKDKPPPPPKKVKVEEVEEEVDDNAPKEKVVEKAPAEEPVKEVKTPPKTVEEKARAKAKKIEEFQEKVASKTILKFVGAVGADGEVGSLIDTLKEGASTVALKDAFIGDGLTAAKDASTKRLSRTSGKSGKVAGLDDSALKGRKVGKVSQTKGKEVAVKGRIKIKKPSEAFGTGVLSQGDIIKVVKRRQGAVKSCYERQLKRNPRLKGKVVMQFTILESGRVGKVKIKKNGTGDPAVADCIAKQMKRWRFPKPDGGSVTVAFPFLFAPAG